MTYEKPESVKKCEENLEIYDHGTGEWKPWTIERVWSQMLDFDDVKIRKSD